MDREKLRILRQQKGLSQDKIAFMCNITPNHYRYIEHGGRNPSVALLKKLAEALDVEPGKLF